MNKKQIVNLTSRMIRIPSLTGDTKKAIEILNLVSMELKGVYSRSFSKNGIVSRIWGNKKNLMRPKLLLNGHIDVINIEGNKKLFTPIIEKDILKGRGSGDMKGFVASMVYAYKKGIDAGLDDISLLLTADEEHGGFDGTKHVITKGLKPKVVLIPDGHPGYTIAESQKAPHHFKIEAKGEGGHASGSYRIDNPVNRILKVYEEMKKDYDLASEKDSWKSTFTMTVINTNNTSINKIPSEVTAAFSWRWPLEQHRFAPGRNKFIRLCKKYNCHIIEEEGGGEGCLTDKNDDYVKKWKRVYEKVSKNKVSFVKTHGAADARLFYNAKYYGSKRIIVTSAPTGGHHENNEWVSIKGLENLAKAIYKYQFLDL